MGKSAGFGKKDQKEPTYTTEIEKLYWDTKQFDWGLGLNLTLHRKGNKYPQWYAAGSAEGLTFNKDKTEITGFPDGWALSTTSEAARFLNTLMDACDAAKVAYATDNLKGFWGMDCQFVNEPSPRNKDKTIPVVKAMASSSSTTKTDEEPDEETDVDAVSILKAMLEDEESIDLDELDSKSVKNYTNGLDYAGRKALVESFPEVVKANKEVFKLKGTVVSLR